MNDTSTPALSADTVQAMPPSRLPRGLPAVSITSTVADGEKPRSLPAIVEQWAAAWNSADAEGMAELFTTDGLYDDHAFQVRSEGRDAIAAFVGITAGNIPDAHAEARDAFQTGDRVAVEWIFRGTPKAFGDTPTTGEAFSVRVATIFEMEGTLIRHGSDYYNLADLLRQIGLPSGPWLPPAP